MADPTEPADPRVGRDAWALDGFAPVPGDVIRLPALARSATTGAVPAGRGPATGAARGAAADEAAPEAPSAAASEMATVVTVYLCAEQDGEVTTRWSWIVLADGQLLETAPRGCALYTPPTLLRRGSGPFLDLVAQDGALVRFEERVRAGTWVERPVRLLLAGRRWRVTATGTVTAHRIGPAPSSGWGPIGAGPEQDVYFTLAALNDAAALGLGIWATDICLAFGRRLGDTPGAAGLAIVAPPRPPA